MKFFGKATAVAALIVETFKSGNVPAKLAQVFIRRNDNIPCRRWSWNNQFITALSGTSDARGFRQWQDAGRKVSKGSKSFLILVPCKRKIDKEDGGEKKSIMVTYGFRCCPVFRIEDTEVFDSEKWARLSALDVAAERFLDALPLRQVADEWGIKVTSFSGEGASALGWYCPPNRTIALGVENLSTWAHEFIHAADDRLGAMKEKGQHWASETVAELGGSILLYAMGYEREADIGGAFEYIQKYAERNNMTVEQACLKVLDRTCRAVALVMDAAFGKVAEGSKESEPESDDSTVADAVAATE